MNNAPLAGFAIRFLVITYLSPVDVLLFPLQGIKIFHFVLTDIFIVVLFFLLCSSIAIFALIFRFHGIIVESFYSIKLLAASPFLIMVTLLT
jgi:hypothetical protein